MSYLSLGFVAFMVCVWSIYNVVGRKYRWYVLLTASLIFYLLYDVKYILFLLGVAITTFACARLFERIRYKKIIFIICILLNVGTWFVIKYLPWSLFYLNQALSLVRIQTNYTFPQLIVPIGISYYILQAIGYLVDVYKGKIEAENNLGKYLLFLAYFPAIVQGPISKYEQLSSQLVEGKRVDFEKFRESMMLIGFGLIKKMVIADNLAIVSNYCFKNFANMYGVILYVGALCYSFQLYMDFSGCVDICRGVSGLFAVELIENFQMPYFSKSIKEFWRRWHISLSTWLKDYVYIPLGGSYKGRIRKYVNLVITFLVSGIWHGAGFHFLFWGVLQAVYQIVGECTVHIRKRVKKLLNIKADSLSENIYKIAITFHLTMISWIFFQSENLYSGFTYLKNMLSRAEIWKLTDGSLFTYGITLNKFFVILITLLGILAGEYYSVKNEMDIKLKILNAHIFIRWTIYAMMILSILLLGAYGSGYDMAGFLYGGF